MERSEHKLRLEFTLDNLIKLSRVHSLKEENMFDLSKLGDMAKLANEAKHIQEKQEHFQKEQIELLEKISKQFLKPGKMVDFSKS